MPLQGKRGGKREGAGRPALPPEQKRIHIDVRLTQAEIDRLRAMGAGNLSRGIRKALEQITNKGE